MITTLPVKTATLNSRIPLGMLGNSESIRNLDTTIENHLLNLGLEKDDFEVSKTHKNHTDISVTVIIKNSANEEEKTEFTIRFGYKANCKCSLRVDPETLQPTDKAREIIRDISPVEMTGTLIYPTQGRNQILEGRIPDYNVFQEDLLLAFLTGFVERTRDQFSKWDASRSTSPVSDTHTVALQQARRPMHYEFRPEEPIHAATGTTLRCKTWEIEAALRMLENNLDPKVALNSGELIVYGGSGRACRNWLAYNEIVEALKNLEPDETLVIQSGKPVYVFRSHQDAPRVIIANSNLVPKWSTQDYFDELDRKGLMMYGQMTAGSWIYIGTQGILQGTYETLASVADKHFNGSLAGKLVLTAGLGAMSGAQPLAITMNDGVGIIVEVHEDRIRQKINEGYLDKIAHSLDEALALALKAKKSRKPLSIGLVGNIATVAPELVSRSIIPDIVTDQTSAHDILCYYPEGNPREQDKLRDSNPAWFNTEALASVKNHVQAILDMQRAGAVCFDYGNNLRAQAEAAGLKVRGDDGTFLYPGFVPAYIRPLFCEGKGPFRWAALSGDPEDILRIDRALLETFPHDKALHRWITKAQAKVPFIGLPTRVCWLGYGDRATFGKVINDLVASGEVKAPIVIGRDHLDCGSVASPNRETEGMMDGSDAVADWPLLNALGNVNCRADWVSIHNGGGVGIGYSTHAGMVIVATGTPEKEGRLKRVLTFDPGIGVARHADAGYERAIHTARKHMLKIPGLNERRQLF